MLYHVVDSMRQVVGSYYGLCAISGTESFESSLLYAFCHKVSLPSKISLLILEYVLVNVDRTVIYIAIYS